MFTVEYVIRSIKTITLQELKNNSLFVIALSVFGVPGRGVKRSRKTSFFRCHIHGPDSMFTVEYVIRSIKTQIEYLFPVHNYTIGFGTGDVADKT
jgi:hypothetical protein